MDQLANALQFPQIAACPTQKSTEGAKGALWKLVQHREGAALRRSPYRLKTMIIPFVEARDHLPRTSFSEECPVSLASL
ncbi:MAG: hypothetical protein ABW065_13105 [Solirubrobacterales bacterium]